MSVYVREKKKRKRKEKEGLIKGKSEAGSRETRNPCSSVGRGEKET